MLMSFLTSFFLKENHIATTPPTPPIPTDRMTLSSLPLEHLKSQPENPFSKLISGQKIALIPSFTLESGVTLTNVPVAYKTSGCLNEARNNVMVICHALTGSADVWDWWGPLIGPGRAFDTGRFFVVCCNSLGSPYGSASPCTTDPETGRIYGPEFPLTTVRDDVKSVAFPVCVDKIWS